LSSPCSVIVTVSHHTAPCAGLFIYVGTMGIIAEEFSKFDDPAHVASVPKGARFYLFAAMMAGFTVVALLQLVPEAG
jgi:hypothetical protein